MEEGSEKQTRGTSKILDLSEANGPLISSTGTFSSVLPNEGCQKIRQNFLITEWLRHVAHMWPCCSKHPMANKRQRQLMPI